MECADLLTLSARDWIVYINGYRNNGWGVRWPILLLAMRILHPLRHWITLDPDRQRPKLVRVGDVRWVGDQDRYILIRGHGLRSIKGTYFSGAILARYGSKDVSDTCRALRFGFPTGNGQWCYAPVERIVLP